MIEYKVRVYGDVTVWRNQNDQIHRLDGPAVEGNDGYQEWWKNGECHRLDGPAIEWKDRSKFWYVDGRLHRLDGPAMEYADGVKQWHIKGREYSEVEFNKKVKEMNSPCEGKIVEVDGIKYKLTKI